MNEIKDAIVVSIAEKSSELFECERSLDELERLLETAGGKCFARVIQVKDTFDPRTVIGSGKVLEVKSLCENNGIELVVFDIELSPMQIRNLEEDLGGINVIDRSMLILDIFALHATTAEGKLQVELSQLRYTAPRLTGRGIELSRQGGGIGTRGPGETKLEIDRRHIRSKISALEEKIKILEHNRAVMRSQRDKSGLPKIAVVGYTNAGKSTLLNTLTGADVLTEDKLFATLDPTTRKLLLPCGETVLITDTVGFIRNLPHHLIKAFKSTLDEVKFADILMIVSDITDSEMENHMKVTEGLIEELGAGDKPRIYVYNKADACEKPEFITTDKSVAVSAKEKINIGALLKLIEDTVHEGKKNYILKIPYNEQSVLSSLYDKVKVVSVDYENEFIKAVAVLGPIERGMFAKYLKETL